MTPDTAQPPQIFDPGLLQKRRDRAQQRALKNPSRFFETRTIEDLSDRLLDVNRTFDRLAYFGPSKGYATLKESLPDRKLPRNPLINPKIETLPKAGLDLVISLLQLQNDNDPVGSLLRARQALKPDGLLIAALFGGETLKNLRQAFYEADTQFLGGVSPRIAPFADHTQLAQLLTRAGLALPVVDIDRFTVNYRKFSTLIEDLRDIGETNVLRERSKVYLGKSYLNGLKAAYLETSARLGEKGTPSSGVYKANFEILWLTGWAPDQSQPKPLKPGSAKIRLGDALDQIKSGPSLKGSSEI